MAADPALMSEWESLQRELAAVKCLSTSFKNRRYVAKYRGQQLRPEREYAKVVEDRFRDPEFTPFAWPLLEAACRVGDAFNVRALVANRGFDNTDEAMLARCVVAAAKRGDESILRCLLSNGGSPNAMLSHKPVQEYVDEDEDEDEGDSRNQFIVTALSTAASASQDHIVAALLDLGADPLTQPYSLLAACESGNLNSCNSIYRWLEQHARDHSPVLLLNYFGQNAVHRAALYGHVPVLDFLLSRAADINHRDRDDRTPLMLAIGSTTEHGKRSRLATVKYLLAHGARCGDVYDARRDTPLLMSFFIATRPPRRGRPREQVQSREILDQRRPTVHAKPVNHDLQTTLPEEDAAALAAESDESYDKHVAADRLSVALHLLSILDRQDQARANALGETILCIACKYDKESFVELALASPAASTMINARTVRGESALHMAARCRAVRIVYLLRQAGADRTFLSRDGLSALAVAVSTGDPDILDALLSPGPLICSPIGTVRARRWEKGGGRTEYKGLGKTNHGIASAHLREALFAAARFGKSALILKLIQYYKVDVTQRDPDGTGNTCLHVAVMHRQHHALDTLKRRGVPVRVENEAGMTAEALARRLGDVEALQILGQSFVTRKYDN